MCCVRVGCYDMPLTCRKTEDLVYDVAFHPSVLEECLKDGEMTEMLVGLCIDYVQNEVDVAKIEDKKNCKRVWLKYPFNEIIHEAIRVVIEFYPSSIL